MKNKYAKFDETLEVAINLGIDSNKTDQGIRGVTSLPKGTGKSINVAVLAKGDKDLAEIVIDGKKIDTKKIELDDQKILNYE